MDGKDILVRTAELEWQPTETVIFFVGHGPLAMLDDNGRICGAIGSDGVPAFGMAYA